MRTRELRRAPWWINQAAGLVQRLPAGRYRAMKWIGERDVDPFWARMPPELGGLLFRCHLGDLIMREVCLTGRYEPQETAVLQQRLRPGMVFVDVGANWGYFTLAAAHLVGAGGRVLSIEVDPRACRTLKDNLARNRLDFVTVCEMAASDVPGTLAMRQYETAANDSGNFGLARSTTVVDHGPTFDVVARPLDDVLDEAGIDRVDLLKMDIEGAEGRALAGLHRALTAKRVAAVLLELHPQHLHDLGSSVERVIAELRGYGYSPWKIDHAPSVYRGVASGQIAVTSAITPLADGEDLGLWPHLLWTA
jgi:FkbM family methyltransferase